jgi:hypothetical protein
MKKALLIREEEEKQESEGLMSPRSKIENATVQPIW